MPKNEQTVVKKSGMVSIVGRPNVGKSTLLNSICGEKISIVSKIPQTTRHQIRGIFTDERGQIVFIDTPGLHVGRDKLDKYMNRASEGTFGDVDVVIYLADTMRIPGQEEEYLVEKIKKLKSPVIFALNKVDTKKGARIPEYIDFFERIMGKNLDELPNVTMLPLSGEKEVNVDKLIQLVFDLLPEGELLYPEDIVTDYPQRWAIADIIREKLFNAMRDELPHALDVVIESIQPKRVRTTHIKALIMVERETQKEIVIGKGGSLLKKIGTEARIELEALLGTKVFLECFVKVQKDWRENLSGLADQGYDLKSL
ncbi:MAG: GTPase Era [Candidatus Omnitrophica bacterium]|nr:GTPase Era [Candidatus Omnitrophota bacterium]